MGTQASVKRQSEQGIVTLQQRLCSSYHFHCSFFVSFVYLEITIEDTAVEGYSIISNRRKFSHFYIIVLKYYLILVFCAAPVQPLPLSSRRGRPRTINLSEKLLKGLLLCCLLSASAQW